jgi:N-methylhydantoinase A
MPKQIRIGADIGGTFTDIVFLDGDGSVRTAKVSSTPDDYARAISEAVSNYIKAADASPSDVVEINHGTTVATNAILERKGARVGLLTTEGFRDVLEIRRVRLPVLYDLEWEKPPPLVPRELRHEVGERIGAGGVVRKPLDLDSVRAAIEALKSQGVESLAVCLLHSYANDAHERAIGELAAEAFGDVSLSCDVLPELREYERTATTVVDAYVKPVVRSYLGRLSEQLGSLGIDAPVMMMQSNGGVISDTNAAAQPVRIIESGPAAGAVAALEAGRHLGLDNIITFDMGGTTAKASVIEGGELTLASEYEVGSGVNQGSRLIKGAGHLIRVPAIDIAEVGAGGGSIAWIDPGGALRVGPESVGAEPGPAAYGRGGDTPTVTDANVVLGYLNPEYLVGGDLRLDAAAAARAIADRIADPLGLSLQQAAAGIYRVANSTMQRAIRAVSIERGRDPRDFTLMAFGGSGPVHAAGLAEALDITRIVIPPWPGLFSAIGLLTSQVEQLYTHSALGRLAALDIDETEALFAQMAARARTDFAAEGFTGDRVELQRYVDLRYRRQISELMIPLPDRPLRADDRAQLEEAFHREHTATYGYDTRDEPVEIVAVKLRTRGRRDDETRTVPWANAPAETRTRTNRQVDFGPDHGSLDTAVVERGNIADTPTSGPLIVEEYDSTVVVPPTWTVCQPEYGFLLLERQL